jgi:hypothetical protein
VTGHPIRRVVAALAGLVVLLLAAPGAADGAGEYTRSRSTSPADSSSPPASPAVAASRSSMPLYAYFYQWFNASSWKRAKKDYPAVGRYTSDDPHVLRDQVQQAKAAGLNGFLTSWKHSDHLDRRLDLLLRVAHDERFDVGLVYEALDFGRNPLPVARVRSDLLYLVEHWGRQLTSRYYGRPVLIWTGTDRYSVADVRSVREALGSRAYLLAASRSIEGYERVANIVDGEAYYWSSADPTSEATTAKLVNLGLAVRAHHGIWIAPATSGFDGRTLGHTRVIDRRDGRTLLRSLQDAIASQPDAIGVISWNEWSENTYIEPGRKYGRQELTVLSEFVQQRSRAPGSGAAVPQNPDGGRSIFRWSGLQAAVALTAVTTTGILLLIWRARRRTRFLMTGRHLRRES